MAKIRRVAVLGAGVMGSGIATHLANAGIDSLLFDMVPRGAGDTPAERSALAINALKAATKSRPASLYRQADVHRITPCNYDDHAALLATADWIVEVVVERLDIKQKVFSWVAEHRKPGSIVSSNTSGITLEDMAAGMPEEMRRHFLVTHFFNPVRYMRLLEIISGPETDPAVVAQLSTFGDEVLGKGIVNCKDTPNFIANRVGTYGMASVFRRMASTSLTVEAIDSIFGPAMCRPKSAVFRTADLVGLDTLQHVFSNLHDYLVEDEERDIFVLPDAVQALISDGRTGQKAGAGFYKKVKSGGKKQIMALDLATMEYRPSEKPRFKSVGAARKASSPSAKISALVYGEDEAAELAWAVTADTLLYAAKRIPEIADDLVNVDRAMRWGFGWDLGPFEVWDAIGVEKSVAKMKGEGRTVPAWVEQMLASGRTSFYSRTDDGTANYATRQGEVADVVHGAGILLLPDSKASGRVIERNTSASLHDLGDGVLGLEFHSKMNALDELIFEKYGRALDLLDDGAYQALVVGNQDPKAFCAGANVLMILMGAMQGQWDQIEGQLDQLQKLMMRARYSESPVVTAPFGMTLGGGAEVAMHSAATVAGGELYMGLVEVGVGLIPGAGGCKELIMRYMGEVPQDIAYDPLPYVQKAFMQIGLGKVSSSAEEARDAGFLRRTDTVTTNPDRLIANAKRTALGLANGGYRPPSLRTVKAPGTTGMAAIELALYTMVEGGQASEHDMLVGKKLGHVLTGGDVPWGTVRTEQDYLDLERESFLSLAGEAKSQARMQQMLQTGKPLRN
jgi:3-hydroxyacyl-CoA dehydrogenase